MIFPVENFGMVFEFLVKFTYFMIYNSKVFLSYKRIFFKGDDKKSKSGFGRNEHASQLRV